MAKDVYLPQEDYALAYYEAQKQARLFFLPFNEYERLADNKIRDDLAPNIPRVNDGSLASILLETPMRVLAQAFTGDVKITESIDPQTGEPTYPQPWLQDLANVMWTKQIVPYANTQAPFLQKIQLASYRASIYGCQPIYTFFTNKNGRHTTDFTLPYIRDVYLEVGKSSDLDSDYIFMDSYYTKLQLDKIIAAGNNAAATGVVSPWKIEELKKIRDSHVESQKEYLAKNSAERNRPVRSTQIKFTTVFQRGVGAPFDTFYAEGNLDGATIVRSKVNEDPTGDIPLHFLYDYQTLINPYGKGQIEISGGNQNVLDYMVQLHVLATQLGLEPPILVEGDRTMTDLDSMVYSPSQFWFTGGAKVDIMETSSSIYKDFPNTYGLYKSNLVNGQGTSTTDIPSSSGQPINGKTPTAINKATAKESSHDNFRRSQAVQTFGRVFKSMLNIKFANMQGEETVRLEADDAVRLMRAGLIPPDPQNPNMPVTKEITVDWDHLRGKFDFTIDPESSIVKDDADQVTKLSEILTLISENPYLVEYIQQTGNQLNLGEVYTQIFTKLGLQDIEKILTPIPQEQMGNTPPPMAFDKPSIDLKYPDLPAAAQLQLLGHVGLNVTMEDILQGPVLDPNIRGVYQPEPEPGNVQNPIGMQPPTVPAPGQPPTPPMPPSPQGDIVLPAKATLVPDVNRPLSQPNANVSQSPQGGQPIPMQPSQPQQKTPAPNGLKPETLSLIQQVAKEKGVSPNVAAGIIHARANGLPEDQIQKWLDANKDKTQPATPTTPARKKEMAVK